MDERNNGRKICIHITQNHKKTGNIGENEASVGELCLKTEKVRSEMNNMKYPAVSER